MDDFYLTKALALLHDPPTKAWIIAGKYHAEGGHEGEARWIKERILGVDKIEYDDCIKNADHNASAFDRWLLSMVAGKAIKAFLHREVILKSILSPKNELRPNDPNPENVRRFSNSLGDLLMRIKERNLMYHVLYALYEPKFLEFNPGSVGPADTRIPTHSIFDHVYACASAVNWTFPDGFDGLLVMVDIAGVQKFISASRKLRDLWISSWLVSALCWASIWKLIKDLGPDVLISPSARNNPFYYHSLLVMLHDSKADSKIVDTVKKVASIWSGYNANIGAPLDAVIPATAILMLPRDEVLKEFGIKDVFDAISNEYVNAYKKLVEYIRNSLDLIKELDDNKEKEKGEKLVNKIKEAFKEAERMGIIDTPPLQLRIVKVSVKDVDLKDEESYLIYDRVYRELRGLLNLTKTISAPVFHASNLTEWSEEKYRNGKSWHYCTVCGSLPAVLEIPREEETEAYEQVIPEKFKPHFSPGERLCFYCMLKRICSFKEFFKEAVKVLMGVYNDVKAREFPSVSDVALAPFKLRLVSFAEQENKENINKLIQKLGRIFGKAAIIPPQTTGFKELDDKLHKLENVLSEEDFTTLKWCLCADSEVTFLSEDVKHDVSEVLKMVKDNEFTTYYSILRADGDSIGKLLSGELEEAIGIKLEEFLLEYIANEELKEVIKDLLDDNKKFVSIVERIQKETCENTEAIKKRLEKASKVAVDFLKKGRISLSPAFHVAISRALMVEAVRNAEEIKRRNGIVVYSGGDDILAIVPVKNSLDVLINTRRSFGAGDGHGFYTDFQGMKSVIPAMGLVGRSYCLLYGHYIHPLSLLLELSVEYLEDVAKKAEWFDCKDPIFKKDTCLITYVPRGSREAKISVLPFKEELKLKSIEVNNFAGSEFLIKELTEDILKGEMSHGLLYRLLEEETIWNLARMTRRKETEKFIDSIVAKARSKTKAMDEAKKLLRFEAKVNSEEFKEDVYLLKEAIKACLSNTSARRVQR